MPNKLVYIGFGFHHHLGGHAGYHQIANYLKYDFYVDAQGFYNNCAKHRSNFARRIRHYILSHLWFGFNAFPWYLIKCMWMALSKGHLTFHFIYGENLFYNSKLLKVRGCKTVVTLHQPYEWFINKPSWIKKLKSVDRVILVGEAEVPLFKKLTGRDNVFFIPHGICSDFYCPGKDERRENMVLTVGNWLRDFQFADKIYQQLLATDQNVRIVIVSNRDNQRFITRNSRIQFLSGITDEELRELYRKTSCLFLPLIRFTANNALLEAGAVGCPVLIACNFSDNSYIPDSFVNVQPMQVGLVSSEIRRMSETPQTLFDLSKYVNDNYSWDIVAQKTKHVLKETN